MTVFNSEFLDILGEFAWDFLLQSTLVLVLLFAIVRVFRLQHSAALSLIYRLALLTVILAPVLTQVLKRANVEGFWQEHWTLSSVAASFGSNSETVADEGKAEGNTAALASVQDQLNSVASPMQSTSQMQPTSTVQLPVGESHFLAPANKDPDVNIAVPRQTMSTSGLETANVPQQLLPDRQSAADPKAMQFSLWKPTVWLAGVWLFVFGIMIARLVRGHQLLARVVGRSEPVGEQIEALCVQLAKQLQVPCPRLVHSPYFSSPFLAGILSPVIHLPSEYVEGDSVDSTDLRAIVVHELAHLKRADHTTKHFSCLSLAVFFFQPLLWQLVRRIEATAEEVCDDYAVSMGVRRSSYAEKLVRLAETYQACPVSAVGIASTRGAAVFRIQRILDVTRKLSLRVSPLGVIVTVVGLLLAVGATSLLLTPSQSEASAVAPVSARPIVMEPQSGSPPVVPVQKQVAADTQEAADTQVEVELKPINGTVFGSDGKPLEGAEVFWWRSRVHDLYPMKPVMVRTDDRGKFELQRTQPNPKDPAIWDMREEMVVRKEGYAAATASPSKFTEESQGNSGGIIGSILGGIQNSMNSSLRLAKAGKPIRGQVLSIEGQPIEGVKVQIRYMVQTNAASGGFFADGTNALFTDKSLEQERRRVVDSLVNVIEAVPLRDALPQATTDANGKFTLAGIADDHLFELLLEKPGVESKTIVVRNFDGNEGVTVPQSPGFEHNPPTKVYPSTFQVVLAPSKSVRGIVTDKDTGDPIANAIVQTVKVDNHLIYSTRERQHLTARTNQNGEFELHGLPVGDENLLLVFTDDEHPYLPIQAVANTRQLKSEETLKLSLKKGVWAEGRVFDASTDEAFQGEIVYYWFRNRELEAEYPGARRAFLDGRYFTDAQGRYKIPVLRTPGVICFTSGNRDHDRMAKFPRGMGEQELANYKARDGSYPWYETVPTSLIPGNYNRVALLEPNQENASSDTAVRQVENSVSDPITYRLDLPLASVQPIPVAVFDSEKRPVNGRLQFYGGNERWGWQQMSASDFQVVDLLPNQSRKIFAYDPVRRLIGGTIVEHGKSNYEIHLEEAGEVAGRLVDKDGLPMANAEVQIDYGEFRSDPRAAIWIPQEGKHYMPSEYLTDDDGRFRISGLSAKWIYNAHVSVEREDGVNYIVGDAFRGLVIKPGERLDLGVIDPELLGKQNREKMSKREN